MTDFAIKVDGVHKNFRLPHEKNSTIKSMFTNSLRWNMKKTTETQHALKDISFEVKKGEFFGIVGRNGSGKSTLLKILAGIYQPTKGNVYVEGKLVPFIELGVGFNPELSGRDNVYLNGSLLGFSRQEIDEMYDEIVQFAELERFMDQKLKNYSSGMQVRLAFAMAIRSEADILLVDEVLAVGDADFQRKCFDYFKKLKKHKKTVVFVSHDMNAVREYCDRVILIDDSKIISQGSAGKIAGKYAKLFMRSDSERAGADQERWGEGTARVANPKIIVSDASIELTFEITARETITDGILGFYLADQQGRQLCGSNTQLLGQQRVILQAGYTHKVSFKLGNIFADGQFSATIAVLNDNGASVIDWWVNATNFSVVKSQHVPFIVDVPVKYKLEKA